MSEPLVTVIIPAFNASRTLDATLSAAVAQTHRELEILVVDDGSSDDTAEIAARWAGRDSRVRLIRRANGGVARARNQGIAEAAGDFVAPLDGDDLWHPEKLARQVAALDAAGSECALAYNWFRRIDLGDRIVGVSASPRISGNVFFRHIDWNFISNGSTPLVRTPIAREIGYDPAMIDGCEDYLFQLRIARRFRFACVPAYLTGYRVVPGGMSSQTGRMIRAHMQAYALLRAEVDDPAAHALLDRRIAMLHVEWARHRFRRQGAGEAWRGLRQAVALDGKGALAGAWAEARRLAIRLNPPDDRDAGERFALADPEAPDGDWATRRGKRWLRHLERLDRTDSAGQA